MRMESERAFGHNHIDFLYELKSESKVNMNSLKPIPSIAKRTFVHVVRKPGITVRFKTKRILSDGFHRRYGTDSNQEARNRAIVGPFTWKSLAVFLATGAGLALYFHREKQRIDETRAAALSQKVGKPRLGGPFTLVDHTGKTVTNDDVLGGHFSLVYFGFTNCPDICPEELDKMSSIVEILAKNSIKIQPVFITCDPNRDSVSAIKEYISDFHPTMIGLTGTYDQIKSACKAYRVYFSTPKDVKPGDDYLVDHSIFFYLMDPNQQFCEAFGRQATEEQVVQKIKEYIQEYNQ